jgi:hypothetical protein
MGARNLVGIGLSFRPARIHRLAELIPGLLKSLKIRAMINQEYRRSLLVRFMQSLNSTTPLRSSHYSVVFLVFQKKSFSQKAWLAG